MAEGITLAQVLAAAQPMIDGSRAEEGNVSYDLFESTTRMGTMVFVETWKDDAAVAVHGKQTHFLEGVKALKPLMKNGMKIEQFPF